MKKQANSAGFSRIGVIVIIAVIAAIAFFGYMSWQQQNTPADQSTVNKQASSNTVEIKEWGVKVALHDADKVQFTVINEGAELPTGQKFDAVATPSFKPQFLKNKDCTPGLSLYRSKDGFTQEEKGTKIGDYYYMVSGGSATCNNDADDQLKAQFAQDFTIQNVTLK